MKKVPLLHCVFLGAVIFTADVLQAQWSSNPSVNTPVSTGIGKQQELRLCKDDFGGVFIAWKDGRSNSGSGPNDIYVQHFNAAGYPQWTANGVALCIEPTDQSTAAITKDMTGGVIVAWSDWRSGIERDVYAQRIDSFGVVQWTLNGVGIATKPIREHNEKIISDDAGGAIIVWEQQSGGQWDIWAQRVSHTGVILWTAGGVPVCTVNANRLNPKVQKDGKGGAYITWQDYRNLTNYDIYAQRLSPSGNLLWGPNGIPICTSAGTQVDPKLDPDTISGGIYVSWIDQRNGIDYDIYAQRVDSMSTVLWANNGVPVVTAAGNQTAQDMLSTTSTNGVIITWKDKRSGSNYDIYAQKLSPAGIPEWTANGVAVCTSPYDQLNPNIVTDNFGGAIIAWQDSSAVDFDIKSQRLDANGIIKWAANGIVVCNAIGHQTGPKSVSDGLGGCIYAWEDKRDDLTNTTDLYAHHLYSNGTTVNNMSVAENTITPEIDCFPNPFSTEINLHINLMKDDKISIVIEDVLGQQKLQENSNTAFLSKGNYTLKITTDKMNYADGVYFVKISGNSWTKTVKMIKN